MKFDCFDYVFFIDWNVAQSLESVVRLLDKKTSIISLTGDVFEPW